MVLMESINVPLGSKAHNFLLMGSDGNMYSLDSFAEAKVLVMIFMCNHCPYVQKIWPEIVRMQGAYEVQGVRFVGVNPNLHPDYDEETMEKMAEYYEKFKMNFPYLQDDTQDLAREYMAQCTPDIYVYNENRKLVYHGRIDELEELLITLLKGDKLSSEQKPSVGCSIKWRD